VSVEVSTVVDVDVDDEAEDDVVAVTAQPATVTVRTTARGTARRG